MSAPAGKGLVVAGHHDGADRIVHLERVDGGAQLIDQSGAQGIAQRRTVQANEPD
jgi:hypothetical protein